MEIAKKLLQLSRNLSYKSKLNVNEVKDAEEELQNSIHSAAFDIEGMTTAMVALVQANDDAERRVAEDHHTSMVAAIALNDAHLAS